MKAGKVKRIVVGRKELIEWILASARKPVPKIVPRVKLMCSDGVWRYPMGIPWGVKTTGETMIAGYAYMESDGTTYGILWPSEQAGVLAWESSQDQQMAEFREVLENASEDRLQEQADYWLK